MNANTAEHIALTAYANAYLHTNKKYYIDQLLRSHYLDHEMPYFRYFTDINRKTMDVYGYFNMLAKRQATKVHLFPLKVDYIGSFPLRIGVAAAGVNAYGIKVIYKNEAEIWILEDDFVGYTSNDLSQHLQDLQNSREKLIEAINNTINFCERNGLVHWKKHYIKTKQFLFTKLLISRHHWRLLPPIGYSRSARQLLMSAVAADMFAGMCSWNDISFNNEEIQSEYEEISSFLFDAVRDAISNATNNYSPSVLPSYVFYE